MKALVYENAHPVEEFALQVADVPDPEVRDTDLLVEVRAIGLNPGEAFIRATKSAPPGGQLLLGWEFAGVVVKAGSSTSGFGIGDRVYGTGDFTRDGCWAERVAIDHRIVGHMPGSTSFADAASLPIGTLTAWESLFRDGERLPPKTDRVLVVGGAGAVGSMAIQLLKAKTKAFVIATASREESVAWCREMGADLVVDHSRDVGEQLRNEGVGNVDFVFSTKGTDGHVAWIPSVLGPYGHLSSCDLTKSFDPGPFFFKSLSLHLEMVFSKGMHGYDPESQSKILGATAALVDAGRIRPITTVHLRGLEADRMKQAHVQTEGGTTIGKVVIEI
jgi:NADPH2:quinone reductase